MPHFPAIVHFLYVQIQSFFYNIKDLSTLLPCARVINDIPAISLSTDPYRTVPTSTESYFTAQQYSTVRDLPMLSSTRSTRTVLSLTVRFSTVQRPSTVQSPTVLLPTRSDLLQCNPLPCYLLEGPAQAHSRR